MFVFWKTDCKFNEDDQTAIVTPNVNDRYNAVLAGMDKEYNHGLCKDYESIEFGFPQIMRTDYTTHYDQHSDCLDKLEAVLKGNGETVVEK